MGWVGGGDLSEEHDATGVLVFSSSFFFSFCFSECLHLAEA